MNDYWPSKTVFIKKLISSIFFQDLPRTIPFDLCHTKKPTFSWSATRSPTRSRCTTSRTNGSRKSDDTGRKLQSFSAAACQTYAQIRQLRRRWRERGELRWAANKVWPFAARSELSTLWRPALLRTSRMSRKPLKSARSQPLASSQILCRQPSPSRAQ